MPAMTLRHAHKPFRVVGHAKGNERSRPAQYLLPELFPFHAQRKDMVGPEPGKLAVLNLERLNQAVIVSFAVHWPSHSRQIV